MKRILFVVDHLAMPGDALLLRLLVSHLANRGADVHVAVLTHAKNVDSAQLGSAWDATVEVVPSAGRDPWRRAVHLRRRINALQPEVIHVWDYRAVMTAGLATTAKRRCLSVSVFEMPLDLPFSIKLLAARQMHRCRLLSCHSTLNHKMVEFDWSPGSDEPVIIPSGVGVTDVDRDGARSRLLEYLNRRGIQPAKDAWLVGAWNRLYPETHIKDLIWANALLNVAGIPTDLVVFGDGPQRHSLLQYALLTEVAQRVHLLEHDWRSTDLMPGFDAFWHSGANRPNPAEMLLAMASGVPVVSALVPETADLVVPQTTAMATNHGARDEVARWTKYLREQDDQRQQLVAQARQFVRDRFSPNTMLEQYERVLTDYGARER